VQSYGQVQQFFQRHPCGQTRSVAVRISNAQGDIIVGDGHVGKNALKSGR
jgi:hypothetical protein